MVVTLSLGSWSTMSKLRVVGQAWPVPIAAAGRHDLRRGPGRRHEQPALAHQQERRLEEVDAVAERHLAEVRSQAVDAVALRSAFGRGAHLGQVRAVEPEVDGDDRVPRQPRHHRRDGRRGTLGDDQRVIDRQRAGARVQDGGLDERAQVGRVGHRAAGRRRRRPVRAGELVRRRQAPRAERVRRDDDVAVDVGRRRSRRDRRGGARRCRRAGCRRGRTGWVRGAGTPGWVWGAGTPGWVRGAGIRWVRALVLPAGSGALVPASGAAWLPLAAGAAPFTSAAAEAQAPRAD